MHMFYRGLAKYDLIAWLNQNYNWQIFVLGLDEYGFDNERIVFLYINLTIK